MKKKAVCGIMLSTMLAGLLICTFNINQVEAIETIYIRTDGSVDPPTAPIQREEDLYTFLGDIIYPDFSGIEIERSNMTLDGNGYALLGSGSGYGILMRSSERNVTIRNLRIEEFMDGIALLGCNSNHIFGNIITNNGEGIFLSNSSGNKIVGNIIANSSRGISFYRGDANIVCENKLSGNHYGIDVWNSLHNNISINIITRESIAPGGAALFLRASVNTITENIIANYQVGVEVWQDNNTIAENSIINNTIGLSLSSCFDNLIYHNEIVNNTVQARGDPWSINIWDNGYPSGGNYWSDYSVRYPSVGDEFHGEDQNVAGGDGIWDGSYEIEFENPDRYPLVDCWIPPKLVGDVNRDGIVNVLDLTIVALSYGCFSDDLDYNRLADLNYDGVVDMRDLYLVAKHLGETDP